MQKQDKYSHIVNEMFFLQAIDQEGKPDIKVKVASLLYDVEVKSVKCRFTTSSTLQMDLKCAEPLLLVKVSFNIPLKMDLLSQSNEALQLELNYCHMKNTNYYIIN